MPSVDALVALLELSNPPSLDIQIEAVEVEDCAQVLDNVATAAILAAVDLPCAAELERSIRPSSPPVLWQSFDHINRTSNSSRGGFVSLGHQSQPRWQLLSRVVIALGLQQPVLITDYSAGSDVVAEWRSGPAVVFDGPPTADVMRRIVEQRRPVLILDM